MVLTRERLYFLRRRYGTFTRSDLARFTVGVAEDGKLRLHSDDPPSASGSIDFRFNVGDTEAWVKALTDAGARRAG